jgi:hypothetical protein
MKSAGELRVEASRMRAFALDVTDAEALAEIHSLIVELEARAHRLENGLADENDDWWEPPTDHFTR